MTTVAATRTPDRVSKFLVPEIVFGQGALSEAGFAARRLHARRVFVVTDPGIIEAGWLKELAGVNTLGDACLTTNPRDATVDEVAAIFRAAL